jgi:hypothetical protein
MAEHPGTKCGKVSRVLTPLKTSQFFIARAKRRTGRGLHAGNSRMSEISAVRRTANFRLTRAPDFCPTAQADLHDRGVSMSKLRTWRAAIPVTRLTTHCTWTACAIAAVMIAAAPVIVVSQTGRTDEPWQDPWSGPWPALLDRPMSIDPDLAALQQRIDVSLERLMRSDREAALSRNRHADASANPHWFPSQIAGREP